MTEKRCYTCTFFEFEGDGYYQIEHCKLHNIRQKSVNDSLEVCDDWCKSKWAGIKKVVAVLRGLW